MALSLAGGAPYPPLRGYFPTDMGKLLGGVHILCLPTAVGSSARRTVRWTVLSENGPVRARWDPMRQHWARAFGRPLERGTACGGRAPRALLNFMPLKTVPTALTLDIKRQEG